jgi:NDP-sugar pyrophosphorylase family protein
MQIIVLCGGLGSRSRTYLGNTPKILAKFGDLTFLDIVLKFLQKDSHVQSVIFATGYAGDEVDHHIDGIRSKYSFSISTVRDKNNNQGAAKSLIDLSESKILEDDFLVMYGDSLPNLNLFDFYAQMKRADTALGFTYISKDGLTELPSIKVIGSRIYYFTPSNSILVGCSEIEYGVTYFNMQKLKNYQLTAFDDLKNLYEHLSQNFSCSGVQVYSEYKEFGNIESYENSKEFIRKYGESSE